MRRNAKWRTMTATQLLQEFVRIMPTAYIVKGRDANFLKRSMENNALDSVDALWAMYQYSYGSGARDIPSFCRWINSNGWLFDGDRLAREGELAKCITNERLPISTLPYYDLLDESIQDARLERSYRAAREALLAHVTQVLGAA